MTIYRWTRGALSGAVLALGLTGAPLSSDAGVSAPGRTVAATRPHEGTPFARVYLALRGCTSCSHCRTSIRQMVRSNAKGGEATFGQDRVEVRYPAPRTVPLREVIRSLAQSRLHDLSVVDVLFEASGIVSADGKGVARFTLAETGQTFPISLQNVRVPNPGSTVRVVALVEGWRTKGALSLVAREVKGA